MRNYTKYTRPNGTRVYRKVERTRNTTERDVIAAVKELTYTVRLQDALKQVRAAVYREISNEWIRTARKQRFNRIARYMYGPGAGDYD